MTSHAACSPSSAAMWLNCAAAVTQTRGMSRPSSRYAREGTAAHAVAEMILKGDPLLPDRVTVEGDEYIVSREMCRNLNPYVTHIMGLTAGLGSASYVFEHRLVVPDTMGMVWGTLDCGVLHDTQFPYTISVVDLKYGKGVAVEPDSPQLRLYALGLAGYYGLTHDRTHVELTVCQPRIGTQPLRSHSTTLGALAKWHDLFVWPALQRIAANDPTENAGHWCRWCVRQTACAAFAGRHQKHAAAAFDDVDHDKITEGST